MPLRHRCHGGAPLCSTIASTVKITIETLKPVGPIQMFAGFMSVRYSYSIIYGSVLGKMDPCNHRFLSLLFISYLSLSGLIPSPRWISNPCLVWFLFLNFFYGQLSISFSASSCHRPETEQLVFSFLQRRLERKLGLWRKESFNTTKGNRFLNSALILIRSPPFPP